MSTRAARWPSAGRSPTKHWRSAAAYWRPCSPGAISAGASGSKPVRLADALRVTPRRTVAFIGAGGKSTALARLAAELASEGPVVITSPAKLALSQAALAEAHLIVQDASSLGSLPGLLEEHRSVLITRGVARNEPKWLGLDLSSLESLKRSSAMAGAPLLIEAD